MLVLQKTKQFYQLNHLISFKFSHKIAELQVIDFHEELINQNADISEKISKSFGPKGCGLALVKNIPDYQKMRLELLPLAIKLANLPKEKLNQLEKPENYYQKGWSCGIENFNGKPDYSKGSFYANPLSDEGFFDEEYQRMGYENHNVPNVWPREDIKELEFAFKNLGKLMTSVGLKLTKHIDKFIYSQCKTYEENLLYKLLDNVETPIGRLLHYYPASQTQYDEGWCGWHNDHSALTCLTSAIFQDRDGNTINNPCPDTGLFAKNRFNDIVKINIPQDMLAFQIGESAQILSGGIIEATPHAVVQGPKLLETGISRSTLAVFMGPKNNIQMKVPQGIDPQQAMNKGAYNIPALEGRWNPNSDTFYTFASKTLKAYN